MTHTYRRPTDRPTSRDASHLKTVTNRYNRGILEIMRDTGFSFYKCFLKLFF